MSFQVGMLGHFFIVEGWGGKHIQIFQAAALQQLSNGTLQRDSEIGVSTKGGKAGAVGGVEQHHADHRVVAA